MSEVIDYARSNELSWPRDSASGPSHWGDRRATQVALLAALLVTPALALAEAGEPLPLWEAGAGALAVSQQAYPGASQNVRRGLLFPFLIYRGEILHANQESVGLTAVKTDRFELDVGFSGAFGSNSRDVEARHGMPDLGTLVEFGPRLKWQLGRGPAGGRLRADFALRGVFDLSDAMRSKGLAFEPRLLYENRTGAWRYAASAGALVGDRRLTDTFYGVAPAYATAARPAYAARSGLIAWRLESNLSRDLSPNWRVFGIVRVDSVAGAANRASPLVQRTNGVSVGGGLIYTWARSDTLVRN